MTKNWKKERESKYSFWVDNNKAGEMEIATNSVDSKATCHIGDREFIVRRTGFWKSSIEITDNNGKTAARTYYEKWYANSSVLEYEDKKYKLIVRNNPLAEWAILDDGKDVLAYGLNAENGEVNVKITNANNNADYLPDFLLWYLFVPIATENMGDNFTFYMLMTAQ